MSVVGVSPRLVSRLLSGYLCGTHSGLLAHAARRHVDGVGPEAVAAAHRAFKTDVGSEPNAELGGGIWAPADDSISQSLRVSLRHPGVLELILFGSQARGGVSGFSDVDAILVISDEAADDPEMLRLLRSRVLAAQRAVLAYQPMQHHGFEVATPKLLRVGSQALGLPAAALADTCSLKGRTLSASLWNGLDVSEPMQALARQLISVCSWPEHVWKAHRLVAMFELLPVLYLQSRGRPVPKWQSFDEARKEFSRSWWPYDALNEVRLSWPRTRRRSLELAAALARNPWAAVAAWRRLPGRLPDKPRALLTVRALEGLRMLAQAMAEQAG